MPTFSKNTRRSASSVGLVSNITYPAPNGSILDSNSDGSDLRHIAGIYRGENIINVEGGITVISTANFSIQLNSQFLNNLTKSITVGLGIELSSQFAQTLTKTTTAALSTDISFSFSNNLTKTVSTSFATNLSSSFAYTTGTVLTAPQISFSIEQGLLFYPTLLSLLSSPKIFLSVDSNVQLLSNLGKTTTLQLSEDLNSQLTPNLTKTTSVNFGIDQSAQLLSSSTKTLVGLSLDTSLDAQFLLTRIKSGSVVFAASFDSQFLPNLTKTTSLSLDLTQGVFIGGTSKTTVINISFGTELCSQFKATAPSILDSNPSTFCFTMYIMKEMDFNAYVTTEKDINMVLKNRC